MNRREFLQRSAWGMLGALAAPLLWDGNVASAQTALEEPYIYRRFLTFKEYEQRTVTERLILHHTGFPGVDKDSTVTEIHKFHIENNGWAGVGYHYLIRKDGTIEQGRRPMMMGAHTYQNNENSIGICLAGNFDIGKPTAEQMEAVKGLTAWLCREYGLDPMRKGVIAGHRDFNKTTCPGKNFYSRLGEIRSFCQQQVSGLPEQKSRR